MVLLKSPGSLPDKGRLSSGREENDWMKKKRLYKVFALLAAMVLSLSLLTGCAGKSTEAVQAQEDARGASPAPPPAKGTRRYIPAHPGILAGARTRHGRWRTRTE